MEFEDVKVFLEIVDAGSIARAADRLHMQQSAASTRLRNLETELGVTLIERQRGVRKIKLTADGENFLAMARQWKSLDREAHALKNRKAWTQLRIACTDSISSFVFADLYPWFMSSHPEIELYLQTEHSTEIHQLIEAQKIDLGFAFNLHLFPNVLSLPLYQDELVILCHKDNLYLKTGDEKDLTDTDEIYSVYSDAYESWHHSIFQAEHHRATIGTLSMLPHFLNYPRTWSIIPHVAADRLMLQHHDLSIAELNHKPPFQQSAYVLYNRLSGTWIRKQIAVFLSDMVKGLQSYPVKILLTREQIDALQK